MKKIKKIRSIIPHVCFVASGARSDETINSSLHNGVYFTSCSFLQGNPRYVTIEQSSLEVGEKVMAKKQKPE